MQNTLSYIFTNLIKYFILTCIVSIWLANYIDNFYIVVSISFLISILIDFVYKLITKPKREKLELNKKEQKEIQDIRNQLMFSSGDKIIDFYYNLFSEKYKVNKSKEYIIVEKEEKKILIRAIYSTPTLSSEEVINSYTTCKKLNISECIIFTQHFNSDIEVLSKMVSDVKITIMNIESTYKQVMKQYNMFPNFNIELTKVNKLKFKDVKNYAINKKLSKNYFFSGLLLIFASFFTKYRLFYTIISTLLFILSLVCFLRTENKISKNIFPL